MAELKTKMTEASVDGFLATVADPARQEDCRTLLGLMQRATKFPPRMWGDSMVGFGSYHYRYDSGREGDWFLAGFAPRKNDLTIYVMSGFEAHSDLLAKLGRHRIGKSCLYVKRLADIDQKVLTTLIERSVKQVQTPLERAGNR